MTVCGYVRVSTEAQDCNNQRVAIYDYAYKNNLTINKFVEVQASSRKSLQDRKTDLLLDLEAGDVIVISELSRLGRSVSEVIQLINLFIQRKIQLIAIKENIQIRESLDLQSKMLVTLFSLFAEIERDLVSQRTKEALRALKRSGKRLGRPKGHGKLILEDREDQVRKLLELQLSYSAISRMLRVDRATVLRFVKRYKIERPTK
jgi:DNA invertase Pin-like site-specific DNA recombinase